MASCPIAEGHVGRNFLVSMNSSVEEDNLQILHHLKRHHSKGFAMRGEPENGASYSTMTTSMKSTHGRVPFKYSVVGLYGSFVMNIIVEAVLTWGNYPENNRYYLSSNLLILNPTNPKCRTNAY